MIKLTDYDYKTKQLKDLRHACLVNCIKASSPEIVLDLLKKKLVLETSKITKDKNTDKTNSKNIKNDINFIKKHFVPKKEKKSAVKKNKPNGKKTINKKNTKTKTTTKKNTTTIPKISPTTKNRTSTDITDDTMS